MRCQTFLLLTLVVSLSAHNTRTPCTNCAAWNEPQQPFRIYGNTYYVGSHGLSSVLITSATGHILIDGALPESAQLIAANIRSLGFQVKDIKLILNSHAHFDHAGGIAALQRLSGARVAVSPWTAEVMHKGAVLPDDPQFGTIGPIAKVARVQILKDGEKVTVGAAEVTAHFTPGHTPGGTSFTWRSCESGRCLNLVYADSFSPVSADRFLFSRRKEYPHNEDFERSFSFLISTPCDILITPHPGVSDLFERLTRRNSRPDALIDPTACRVLAETSRTHLHERLAKEAIK